MAEYYGDVGVQAAAVSFKYKGVHASVVEGSGHLRSNDLQIARNLSEGLTGTVDHAIGYAHDLHPKRR